MRRVVAIGGAGKWFGATYRSLLAAADGWTLTGIVDLRQRLGSAEAWLGAQVLALEETDSPQRARKFIEDSRPDLVIVSTGPESHADYCSMALAAHADVICDKPPVAIAHQFSTLAAGLQIADQFAKLLELQETSRRRDTRRPCHVFLPLRRRRHRPFGPILHWLGQVAAATGVQPTSIDIAFNDGSFRCAEEYDRPGAHGYRSGLGVLTHTGYHFIDFAAACLSVGGNHVESVRSTRLTGRSSQAADTLVERSFFQMLGRDLPVQDDARHPFNGEVDARFHLDVTLANGQSSQCNFALMHHGCTRRQVSSYDEAVTHDDGRVDDLTMMIQQGAFQSVQLLIADSAGGAIPHGHCVVVRRVHPTLASRLGVEAVSMQTIELPPGDAAAAYAECIGDFLAVMGEDGPVPAHVAPFALAQQGATAAMYASFFAPGQVISQRRLSTGSATTGHGSSVP